MNRLTRLMAALACATPLIAGAQTSGTPSSMDTAPSPNIKPADATTSGKNTGNDNATNSTHRATTAKDAKTRDKSKDGAPVGGVSSYPAPTRDGTPTSPSTTK